MLTLEELDEALQHARAVPEDQRGAGWRAFVDGLLEQRAAIQRADARLAEIKAERTAVVFSGNVGR